MLGNETYKWGNMTAVWANLTQGIYIGSGVSAVGGAMRYASNTFSGYNGTDWIALATGGAADTTCNEAQGYCNLILYTNNLTDNSMTDKHNHSCENITGATSDLCSITDTHRGNTTQEMTSVMVTQGFWNNSQLIECQNITGNTSDLCALTDTDTHRGNTTNEIWVVVFNGTFVEADTWTSIDNYPSACSAGQYVSTIGDTLTCSTPSYTTDTDTNASSICSGTTTYLDGEGNCDDISGVYVQASDWTTIDNYPSACSSGQYVTSIGDTLTCATEAGNSSGEIMVVVNSTDINSTNWINTTAGFKQISDTKKCWDGDTCAVYDLYNSTSGCRESHNTNTGSTILLC